MTQRLWFKSIFLKETFWFFFILLTVTACTHHPPLKLGQEYIPANETKLIQDITNLLIIQLDEKYDPANMRRDAHPKSNGCVMGQFKVEKNLPDRFRKGIFSKSDTYPAWLRFSNAANEVTPDKKVDFRGLAIKLFGVEGERLSIPGDELHTQDFLLTGFPAFFIGNPQDFLDFVESRFHHGNLGVVWHLLTHPRTLWNSLKGRDRYPNLQDITWFSAAPFRLGEEHSDGSGLAVKYKAAACAINEMPFPEELTYDYLREGLKKDLEAGDLCMDFWVQEQKDSETMPIEDTSIIWDEEKSPFLKIATITIQSQTVPLPNSDPDQSSPKDFTSHPKLLFCENLTFNPWHGLKAHKPLGGINRARRDVMKALSDHRLSNRQFTHIEPNGNENFEKEGSPETTTQK